MMLLFNALVLAVAAASVTALKAIPDFIHVCSRLDPNLNQCVTDSVLALRPMLAQGIPELNVPSIEPLLLGDMVALEGAGITLKAYGVSASECSKFELSDLKMTPGEKVSITFQIQIPLLRVTARYEVNGEVLGMPLSGNGPLEGEFKSINADVAVHTNLVGGFMKVDSMSLKVKVGGGKVNLENLGSDASLSAAANDLINANFNLLATAIMPSIERSLNEKIGDMIDKVFAAYTYDQLLPAV